MPGAEKKESVFSLQMGPAFFAVILSIVVSFGQFVYSQGQQATVNENTKVVIDKLEKSIDRQENRQNSFTERLVKVETIVSTIQASLLSIDSKIDRLSRSGQLDKN